MVLGGLRSVGVTITGNSDKWLPNNGTANITLTFPIQMTEDGDYLLSQVSALQERRNILIPGMMALAVDDEDTR